MRLVIAISGEKDLELGGTSDDKEDLELGGTIGNEEGVELGGFRLCSLHRLWLWVCGGLRFIIHSGLGEGVDGLRKVSGMELK